MNLWRWFSIGSAEYVNVREREADFRSATYAQYADRVSCVVSHARVVTAADRGRAREQQRPSNVTYMDRSA